MGRPRPPPWARMLYSPCSVKNLLFVELHGYVSIHSVMSHWVDHGKAAGKGRRRDAKQAGSLLYLRLEQKEVVCRADAAPSFLERRSDNGGQRRVNDEGRVGHREAAESKIYPSGRLGDPSPAEPSIYIGVESLEWKTGLNGRVALHKQSTRGAGCSLGRRRAASRRAPSSSAPPRPEAEELPEERLD